MTARETCRPKRLRVAQLIAAGIALAGTTLVAAAQPQKTATVIEKVRSIAAGVLEVPTDKLGDDTALGSLPRPADDLDVVEIVLALEEAFTIQIPDAEVERAGGGRAGQRASLSANLTVAKLAALVQRQLDGKPKVKPRPGRKSR